MRSARVIRPQPLEATTPRVELRAGRPVLRRLAEIGGRRFHACPPRFSPGRAPRPAVCRLGTSGALATSDDRCRRRVFPGDCSRPRGRRVGYDECGGDAVASCSASSSLATSSRVIASARDGRPRGRLSEIAEPVSQISTRTLSRFGNSPERVSVNVPEAFPVLLLEAGGARGADWGAAQAPHRPGWADGARRDALRRAGCAGAQHIDAHASVERERAVAGAPRLGRGALSRARRCRSR